MNTERELKVGSIQKWQKSSMAENKRQSQKERIREAYKNGTKVEIIPAKSEIEAENKKLLRVAAYCRVSTDEDAQAGSYELQLQYYREMIHNNPDWELVDIYADEGISGTSVKRRINFLRMIDDCHAGKIDMIITKSVSRFARNTLDCLDNVRKLKALNPPVGVLFETEGFNTAESKNEFTLGIMSLVAQGESEQKSASIRWSIIQRFKKGIPIIPTHCLLGYDKDRFGNLFIVPEEAEVVKYIFACYLDGSNARDDWRVVQEQLKSRRHPSRKKDIPIEKKFYIHRVKGGLLRGFAVINPKWNKREVELFLQKIKNERGT